jgi:hypothetical protein
MTLPFTGRISRFIILRADDNKRNLKSGAMENPTNLGLASIRRRIPRDRLHVGVPVRLAKDDHLEM